MEEPDYSYEKDLKGFSKAISIGALEFLILKCKESICKIYCNDNGHGTGFFSNIQYDYNIILKVLISNNHVLKEDDLTIGKKIKFSINDEAIFYEIIINKSRKIYTSKKYDVTIIELKFNDKLDKISFFDIDNQIFRENSKELYINKLIYLLHYPKGKEMKFSDGIIRNFSDDNYTIRHICDTSEGSSGGPIINAINLQLIGIHKGGAKGAQNFNLGTFMKEPIGEFKDKIQNMENNNKNISENNMENKNNSENFFG